MSKKKNEDVVEIRGYVLRPDRLHPMQWLHFKGSPVECKHYSKRVANKGQAAIILEYWIGTLNGVTYYRIAAREVSGTHGYLFNVRGTKMEELFKDAEIAIHLVLEEQIPYELNQLKLREEEVKIQLRRIRMGLRTLESFVVDDFVAKADKRALSKMRTKLSALMEDV